MHFLSADYCFIHRRKTGCQFLNRDQPPIYVLFLNTREEKANSYRLTVRLRIEITKNGNIPLNGSLLLNARKDSSIAAFLPGDILKVRCSAIPVANRGNPEEFDYRFYLENRGIKYSGFITCEDIEEHIAPSRRKLKHRALIIREKIIGMYEKRGITGKGWHWWQR